MIQMKVSTFPNNMLDSVDLREYSNIEESVNPDIATVRVKVISSCHAKVMDIDETIEITFRAVKMCMLNQLIAP